MPERRTNIPSDSDMKQEFHDLYTRRRFVQRYLLAPAIAISATPLAYATAEYTAQVLPTETAIAQKYPFQSETIITDARSTVAAVQQQVDKAIDHRNPEQAKAILNSSELSQAYDVLNNNSSIANIREAELPQDIKVTRERDRKITKVGSIATFLSFSAFVWQGIQAEIAKRGVDDITSYNYSYSDRKEKLYKRVKSWMGPIRLLVDS